MTDTESQSENKKMLKFQDREKVDGILNAMLSPVIATTMENHIVFCFLIDDESSCNTLYIDTLKQLGLRH